MIIENLKKFEGYSIIDNGEKIEFSDLYKKICDYQLEVEKFISKADVVLIKSDYSINSISLLLALSKFPCIIVPIIHNNPEDYELKVNSCEANIELSFKNEILELKRITNNVSNYELYKKINNRNNCGIVLFSSGSTGKPKVMCHDFTNLLSSYKVSRRQKKLNFLIFLLFDHIGGLNTLINCLSMGSTMVINNERSPNSILKCIDDFKVNILPTTPTFLNLLVISEELQNYDLSSLKLITYGTERMPQTLLEKINNTFKNVKLLQTFGTSETGILKTKSKSSNSLYFKILNDDIEYKIIDDELIIKTKNNIGSYKNHKSLSFTNDGWFKTGDLVTEDNEGYIKIIGRKNEIINVGGLKVMPQEVESIINTIKDVIDCSVFAVDNIITGQAVGVKIIAKNQANKSELKYKILALCKTKLEKFKIPVKFKFASEINHTDRFKKTI